MYVCVLSCAGSLRLAVSPLESEAAAAVPPAPLGTVCCTRRPAAATAWSTGLFRLTRRPCGEDACVLDGVEERPPRSIRRVLPRLVNTSPCDIHSCDSVHASDSQQVHAQAWFSPRTLALLGHQATRPPGPVPWGFLSGAVAWRPQRKLHGWVAGDAPSLCDLSKLPDLSGLGLLSKRGKWC